MNFKTLAFTIQKLTHRQKHRQTDKPKAICPSNFFKVGGIITQGRVTQGNSGAMYVILGFIANIKGDTKEISI